ncbi:LOW QUALITY PROTEIN: hypothetical protein PHMEG_0002732 [Phytophthora megakarya]|uniref:Uncharacterized protein n=1 Tax=Phytophthora megakarya TaxID=4795 RepID=A0A225WY10_9STRA|nr:LOW QUALITY PROTEIN: hypothetical protein PHMEG_0002732 [Phytophthora megakarya]
MTLTKSKGRPKLRRKQVREAKKLRMEKSVAEAIALVQGTLVPVKCLALVRKTFECYFNMRCLFEPYGSIVECSQYCGAYKETKINRKVKIVFPKPCVTKFIAGIETYRKSLPTEDHSRMLGVTIKKFGAFTEKNLNTMRDWNDEMSALADVSYLCDSMRVFKFSRIFLPSPLNNWTTVDLEACSKRLETVHLKLKLDTRFGRVAVPEVAFFRRSEWLDDSCMKLVMSHLIDQEQDAQGQSRIGCVNPLMQP